MNSGRPSSAAFTSGPSSQVKPPEGVWTYPPMKSASSASPVPSTEITFGNAACTSAVLPQPGAP